MNKSLIIIPTYNEKENIEAIISAIFTNNKEIDILVVDDSSPDGTGEIADRLSGQDHRVHVLHRQKKEGLGRAYIEGFRFALDKGYDYVFEMDADFSHNPKHINRFLEEIAAADLVIGSRYTSGVNVINWPMSRLLLSYFANLFAQIVTGLSIKDATGGYKCFRRSLIEALDLDTISSDGYSFQIEVNFKAWKMGYTIKEIPIVFYERQKGKSKMSSGIIREALWLIWKMRVVNLFRPIKRKKS